MTNSDDMREAFDLWSEQHGEEPIFPLQVWEAACQWQTQQAQGKPVTSAPVAAQHRFRHPQKSLQDWSVWQPATISLDRPSWEIDSQGFEVEYRLLYAAPQPSKAQVPDFDKKLFDSECRESVAGALGFQKGGDYAWSYLLAQIKEAVAAADMPPETTAPSVLPEGWRVGNLVTMNQDEYPGLGGWFTQIWCGDDVVARIYGEDHEQIRERIDTILTASPTPEHSGDGNEMVAPDVDHLVQALEELIDLMEDTRQGEYIPDSFTTQPARIALDAYRKQEGGA